MLEYGTSGTVSFLTEFYVYVLFACVSCAMCLPGTTEARRGHHASWDMGLQMVVSSHCRYSKLTLGLRCS